MEVSNYTDQRFLNQYKKTPLLHNFVVFPALLKVIGKVKHKKILDLGCGFGDLSILMAKKGANVVGIDISEKWIDMCKSKYIHIKNLDFIVADGSDLQQFKNETFDFVIMNMVLLNVPTIDKVKMIFKEISRILKKSGQLIFSDLHPLALMINKTKCETQTYLPNFSYFKNGSRFKSKVKLTDGSEVDFVDVHWTLETYTLCLSDAQMYTSKIIEPQPIKNAPPHLHNYKVPEHIIFTCKKFQ